MIYGEKVFIYSNIFSIKYGGLALNMEVYAMQSNLNNKEKSIVEISAYTSAGDLQNLSTALNEAINNKINEV